jgi:hypothetical protein
MTAVPPITMQTLSLFSSFESLCFVTGKPNPVVHPNTDDDLNAPPWLEELFGENLPKMLNLSDDLKQFSDLNHPNYPACVLILKTLERVTDKICRKAKGYQCCYERDISCILAWLNSLCVLELETITDLQTVCSGVT